MMWTATEEEDVWKAAEEGTRGTKAKQNCKAEG